MPAYCEVLRMARTPEMGRAIYNIFAQGLFIAHEEAATFSDTIT